MQNNNAVFLNIMNEKLSATTTLELLNNFKNLNFSIKNIENKADSDKLLSSVFFKFKHDNNTESQKDYYDLYKKLKNILCLENGFDFAENYVFRHFLKEAEFSNLIENIYTSEDKEVAINIYNTGLLREILSDGFFDSSSYTRAAEKALTLLDFNTLNEDDENILFEFSRIEEIESFKDFISKDVLQKKNKSGFNYIDRYIIESRNSQWQIDDDFFSYLQKNQEVKISQAETVYALFNCDCHENTFKKIISDLDISLFEKLKNWDFNELCVHLNEDVEEIDKYGHNYDNFKRKAFYFFTTVMEIQKSMSVDKETLINLIEKTKNIVNQNDIITLIYEQCINTDNQPLFYEIAKEWIEKNSQPDQDVDNKKISKSLITFLSLAMNPKRIIEESEENIMKMIIQNKITSSLFKMIIGCHSSALLFFARTFISSVDEKWIGILINATTEDIVSSQEKIKNYDEKAAEYIFGDKGRLMQNKMTTEIFQNKLLKILIKNNDKPKPASRI